ncbi:MAG: hypothetical protein R2786_06985 [Flavobacteriaceae bacterium]
MKQLSIRSISLLFVGLFLFTGCKTQLAPEYDKAIVEGLTKSTQQLTYFFATMDEGTTADSYTDRQTFYNTLIGNFDALSLQAKARPVPSNAATEKINKLLQAKGSDPLSGAYPSAFAFTQISETLRKMRQTDQANGLKPLALQAFKGQILIFLDQAMTYESFLKR